MAIELFNGAALNVVVVDAESSADPISYHRYLNCLVEIDDDNYSFAIKNHEGHYWAVYVFNTVISVEFQQVDHINDNSTIVEPIIR